MIGIRPEHTLTVIKDIIEWHDKNYLIEEKPTSAKALAHWAYNRFEFRSKKDELLAENTVQQLFGEKWRETHDKIVVNKSKGEKR